jgi:hypothetical protein
LDLGIDLQNDPRCPPMLGFFFFLFLHHYISDFCGTLKSFWNSFMPLSFVWALLIIEDFLSCPLVLRTFSCPPGLFGHFYRWGLFHAPQGCLGTFNY